MALPPTETRIIKT